jgi:hypothetical protein
MQGRLLLQAFSGNFVPVGLSAELPTVEQGMEKRARN